MESAEVVPEILRSEVSFAPESPLFADHFPNQPIVPAYAQLAKVLETLSEWRGRAPARIRARMVKFLRPIEPGSVLELRVEVRGEGWATFALYLRNEVVTRGEVSFS